MSEQVRQMFSAIAPRYDVTNSVLSMGIHQGWRRVAVKTAKVLSGEKVLDCATGTGDLALAFKRAVGNDGKVIGTDFCAEMLEHAPQKAARAGLEVEFSVADAQSLPFTNASFDVASIAFGIRNVDDPVRCLREMAARRSARVKPCRGARVRPAERPVRRAVSLLQHVHLAR